MDQAYPIEFSTNIPADTPSANPAETTREMPFDGQTVTFIAGWPAGAQNGVGIQLRRNEGERLFPRNPEDNFIAADDFTHAFALRTEVSKGEKIDARFVNVDQSNSHFVNAVLVVEEGEH